MSTLHIVNKSSTQNGALQSCLRFAQAGSSLLLIEDGIYAATTACATASGIADAGRSLKVYALQPDVEARGMQGRLAAQVQPVDYAGFVALVAGHARSQSWL